MSELFVSAYNAKNYAQIEAEFNAQMKSASTLEKLKEFLDGLQRDLRKIVKLGAPNLSAEK